MKNYKIPLYYLAKDMKLLKTALKFSSILKLNLPAFKSKITPYTLTAGGLATGYAFYLSTQKVFAE